LDEVPELFGAAGVRHVTGSGVENTVMDAKVAFEDAERYRLLVGSITDYAIYMLDPTGLVTSWNPGAQRFKGYAPAEIIGKHFSRFYTREDQEVGLPARALKAAEQEGKFEGEGWRVRKDGSHFWAHVVIDPIRSEQGRLLGFAKITRDLTERRAADATLRRSEEQFRLLVQGVTDYAIYMLDPAGYVTSWNAGARRIKGYEAAEIIGQHFSVFYTNEDRKAGHPEAALETARRTGRFEKEGLRVRKDGSTFRSHVVIDAIRDDAGEILGFAKVTRDVTERAKVREELERAREALFQSQKMDAVGQLTGGVAHDFNNLLMAILGSLELLQKKMPDDPQKNRLLDNAIQGAKRGAALTQRMLAFARRQQLDPQPIALADLVRGMTDLLQSSLGPLISIETHFPPELPKALADENQLELAILNLCVNSRDAMPGGGTITLSAQEQCVRPGHATKLSAGNYICVTVADQGDGMTEETLQRATEPFFTTKGVGRGTGLGLSMVHGMTEQMGGRLILTSLEHAGTKAAIWLPVAGVADEAIAVRPASNGRETGQPRTLTILAVDDDALVLLNTTAMLEELGHKVYEANSGEAALNLLRTNDIDLVITDQAMPRMTGLQLAEAIEKEWPGLPIVLATGYAELPRDARNAYPKLNKPFTEMQLAEIVDATGARMDQGCPR
jgi:PAS domain S-box-containing protein